MDSASISGEEEKSERCLYVKGFNNDSTNIELWVQVTTQDFLKDRSLIVHNIQEFCERENIPLKKIEFQT